MQQTIIPTKQVGPIKIIGDIISELVEVPLATYEKPLWHSTSRGAKVSRNTNGINVFFIDEKMSRSIALEGKSASDVIQLKNNLQDEFFDLYDVVSQTSRFAKLLSLNCEIVGRLIYIRFEFSTGDASGHNMVTKGANALCEFILSKYSNISYVSISGNYCIDKKASAVNGILGRGKNMIAEIEIPEDVCKDILKTTPEKIVKLNIKKNLIGSILAGSIRSANAHYANFLLAFYLATGQDAANIIEGSQGITTAEVNFDNSLYFSVSCPNLILGTVGNGKEIGFARENMENMGCCNPNLSAGENSRRLAGICIAGVLCSELNLLAVQTQRGELISSHERIERK